MRTIDIIKPLSTVLSSAINKSRQHQDKKSWELLEASMLQLCYTAPSSSILFSGLSAKASAARCHGAPRRRRLLFDLHLQGRREVLLKIFDAGSSPVRRRRDGAQLVRPRGPDEPPAGGEHEKEF